MKREAVFLGKADQLDNATFHAARRRLLVLEQQTELQPTQIMTDTGPYSDVVFGLFRLLGLPIQSATGRYRRHPLLANRSKDRSAASANFGSCTICQKFFEHRRLRKIL
jgi:TnpA family transposase